MGWHDEYEPLLVSMLKIKIVGYDLKYSRDVAFSTIPVVIAVCDGIDIPEQKVLYKKHKGILRISSCRIDSRICHLTVTHFAYSCKKICTEKRIGQKNDKSMRRIRVESRFFLKKDSNFHSCMSQK